VTVPYSPEFADLESNQGLLEKLRDITGGETIPEALLTRAADPKDKGAEAIQKTLAGEVFRPGLVQFKNLQPIWYWLVFLSGILLFCDVAVRRVALQPAEVASAASRLWAKLRRQAAAAPQTPQFMDRLKSRKAEVAGALEQLHAASRFTPADRPLEAPSSAQAGPGEPSPGKISGPPSPAGTSNAEEGADYASRLLKAKQKVWQEREKEKD